MCDYTYFDAEKNCLKSKLEVMRYHLVVAFCMIINILILQGVIINVSKMGSTKSFSKAQFMVHRTE